ncbi:MAG: hypothetical protein PHV30_05205 [Candidatus Margulisbacteria bacterium]|nr:hypothetical protein [Candidatus Margulisiibacteriota bacterium]
MKKKQLMLILLCGFIFGGQAQNFKSTNISGLNSYKGGSNTFQAQTRFSETLSDVKQDNNYLNLDLANEILFKSKHNEFPSVINITVSPSYLILGQDLIMDIELSEALQDWASLVKDLNPVKSWARNNHIYVQCRPLDIFDGTTNLLLTLLDYGQNQKIYYSSLNIIVDDGLNPVPYELLETGIADEVHTGSQINQGVVFNMQARHNEYVLKNIKFSINPEFDFTQINNIALYTVSGNNNELLGKIEIPQGYEFTLNVKSQQIIDLVPKKYMLGFDLADSTVSGSLKLTITSILTRKLTGNMSEHITTANMSGKELSVVPKSKPIITESEVYPFVGKSQQIEPDVVYLDPLKQQLKFRYSVVNADSGKTVRDWEEINVKSQALSETNGQQKLYSLPTKLPLEHNQHYQLIYELVGVSTSKRISSNIFLADLTPPLKPSSVLLQPIVNQNLQQVDNNLTLDFMFNASSALDPESGLASYRIMMKSSKNPYWKNIYEDNVITAEVQTVPLSLPKDDSYTFKVALKNKAGDWGDFSEEYSFNNTQADELVKVLFNAPNPFDSRKENTTIYYTLGSQASVEIDIYSLFGYFIKKWNFTATELGTAGDHILVWDGTNVNGMKVAKGVYILILKATDSAGKTQTKKYKLAVVS